MKSNQDFIDHTLKQLIKECRAAGPDFCAAGGVIKAPNSKQAGAKTITIAPVVTCPGAKKAGCIGACYACCGRYRFGNVAASVARNTALALYYPERFFEAIRAQLDSFRRPQTIRVHVAGDFFAQRYVDQWAALAAEYRRHHFFAYTKSAELFDFSALLAQRNFSIVNSVLPPEYNGGLNFGPRQVIDRVYQDMQAAGLPVYLCQYGQGGAECGTKCRHCYRDRRLDYVLFYAHGQAAAALRREAAS